MPKVFFARETVRLQLQSRHMLFWRRGRPFVEMQGTEEKGMLRSGMKMWMETQSRAICHAFEQRPLSFFTLQLTMVLHQPYLEATAADGVTAILVLTPSRLTLVTPLPSTSPNVNTPKTGGRPREQRAARQNTAWGSKLHASKDGLTLSKYVLGASEQRVRIISAVVFAVIGAVDVRGNGAEIPAVVIVQFPTT